MLAAVNLNVNSDTLIYTVPGGKQACVTVNVLNRNTQSIKVRMWLTNGGAPAGDASQAIEWDTALDANTPLERSGIVLKSGQAVYARTDTANTNVVVFGIEE